jgi:hypothetical protein
LEALVARDFVTLDAMVGAAVRPPAGWTAVQASAVLVARLGAAVGRALPADRQLDLAAQRMLAARLERLQARLAELGTYARAQVDLFGALNQRVVELPAEVGWQIRPHRGSVSGTSEQRDDGRAVPPQGRQRPCTHWAAAGWTVTFAGSQTLVTEELSVAGAGGRCRIAGSILMAGDHHLQDRGRHPRAHSHHSLRAEGRHQDLRKAGHRHPHRTRRVGDHLRQDGHQRAVHGGGAGT